MGEAVRNWAGNVVFEAARFERPTSVEQLQQLVAGSARVRALGAGHSFNRIADTSGTLVSLAALPPVIEIDSARSVVQISGGLRYGELALPLHRQGFALHNLASLPHISVAGACATATHGSGDRNANLAAVVSAMELVTPDGELRTLSRAGDTAEEFLGSVVGLGALGIVSRLWLDLEPSFQLRQHVFDNLCHDQLLEHLDQILAGGYSVSLFTQWGAAPRYQVWLKRRVTDDDDGGAESSLFGATAAPSVRHPLPGMTGENCTEQFGVVGPWHERLPHFRLEFVPSRGEELQSEYLVARRLGRQAIEALAGIGHLVAPVLQICELRSVAADELWLSSSYHQDSLGLHFTWIPDAAAVTPVIAEIERRLAPFGARPHWAKLFGTEPDVLRGLYDRYADFERLLAVRDPAGKFGNNLTARYFLPS